MSYGPPDELWDTIGTSVSDITASLQLNSLRMRAGPNYSVIVSTPKWLVTELQGDSIPPTIKIPKLDKPKGLRVRVYETRLVDERVVRLGVSPRFRLSPTGRWVELLDTAQDVAAALDLRFKVLLARRQGTPPKHRRIQRKGSTLRPQELVIEARPYYHWDGPNYSYDGTNNVTTYSRDWTGERTPDFKRKLELGQLPVNPHHVLIWTRRDAGTYFNEEWLDLEGYGTGYFHPYTRQMGTSHAGPDIGVAHASSQRNKAIQRLRERAVGETQNLSETVATLNQTFGMIGNMIGRIAGSLKDLKSGNFQGAIGQLFNTGRRNFRYGSPRFTKDLASNWLELQYGWKPLINDVHYVLEALGKRDLANATMATARSSATSRSAQSGVLRQGPSTDVLGGWSAVTSTTTRLGVRFKVQDPFRAFLSQSGFTNPVSLGWELLPFSFVFDWFLPVGSYLESLDSWGGLVFMDGFESTFTRLQTAYSQDYEGYHATNMNEPPTRYTTVKGAFWTEAVLFDRARLTSFPSMDLPTIKSPFSLGHALNGMALLRQVFGR